MKNMLLQKYNVPGPRYTSYPTVPYWNENMFEVADWKATCVRAFNETNTTEGISLYIHLPFCESMCTFCGCNKRITKRHDVEQPYIAAVLKEWDMYCAMFEQRPLIKELHLGGGTPTFFSPESLQQLIEGIFEKADRMPGYEYSFEGHPNNTTRAHLQTLFNLGFRRVSFGVQDYNETVQQAIHRIQPFHNVAKVTFWAREIGYTSISHDLVFGLPFQTVRTCIDTVEKTKSLNPDRIAFYSYAHVPWIKGNGQRGFEDCNLPRDEDKRKLYEAGKHLLAKKGFREIGMDHFALETDSMYKAFKKGELHRNFMGYSSGKTRLMVGLGVSSISDSWYSFAQNEKTLEDYYQRISFNELPVFKGHLLTDEDLVIRQHILNLMCRFETSWNAADGYFDELAEVLDSLTEMEQDGLISFGLNKITVTEAGKPYVRNICMAFDLRLKRRAPQTQLFSMVV
ncbi:oxygen-independent coproporphyrinogen III oxidase [Flavobacterium psychrotrophum]|uniref:oxygen-independent coproporphyrinogen III oxidase n=1 Tax=Flavobacterium psychrotrophum TaxID=2294119 RepID=UPI000E3177D2|nr:oxygen-independent coproporphyrinogen III oxidase [Flavobacterium psychrotrophum]